MTRRQIIELIFGWCRTLLPFASAALAAVTAYFEREKFWIRCSNSISAAVMTLLGCYLVYARLS